MKVFAIIAVALAACAVSNQTVEKCNPCNRSVIVFLGIDCPISQKYVSRLNQMFLHYGDTIRWYGYVPQKISDTELATFIREYDVKFPLAIDRNLQSAKQFKASVTPEAFLFGDDGKIVYAGAIDNWFYELGKYRPAATEFYLEAALKAVLAHKNPTVSSTKAVGCFIQFK
jgi:hypothetical protein